MALAIVKAPGPDTRVLEPLRSLAELTPHMPAPIHHRHTEATSAVFCMFFFAAGLEKRKRRKRHTGLPKQLAELGSFYFGRGDGDCH